MPEHASSFATFLATQLNKEQHTAVTHTKGPLLVVAGAGSGKTRVITARIANLILSEDVDPSAIIALTFTNKAAREMKERISTFLENAKADLPFIGTFHSYCLLLLKKNLTRPFTILDADDQNKLVNSLIKRKNMQQQVKARPLLYAISRIKNELLVQPDIHHATHDPAIKEFYFLYEQEKRLSNCFDFDDLLLETLKLFKRDKEFKEQFLNRVRHVLVDEYQDTNVVQHALLKQMVCNEKQKFISDSLCVVGDEDQSIYSWRGATVANIINFKKDFPKTRTIKIEQNYRSVQSILTVANHVIKNNANRNPKKLWSARKGTNRIKWLTCTSDYQESQAIAQLLQLIEKSKKQKLSSTAILYRTHSQSRSIEEALIRHSIPYTIVGGIQFYERKEIKDLLAYLRLVVNPFDRVSFFRVVNCPPRKLGAKFEELIREAWVLRQAQDEREEVLNCKELAEKLIRDDMIVKSKAAALQNFIRVIDELSETTPPSDALESIINNIEYVAYLKNTYDPTEAAQRHENVKELIRAAAFFEAQGINTTRLFLEEIALMQDPGSAKATPGKFHGGKVQLMTLHAAKGLEFDTVIIPGLEEGLLPSARSLNNEDAIEEERRLFYVGITRARERLLLLNARYRYTYGQTTDQVSSRFLDEVPKHLCAEENASYWKEAKISTFFASWLGVQLPNPYAHILTFAPAAKSTTKKKTTKKITRSNPSTSSRLRRASPDTAGRAEWRKLQPVKHKIFGMGMIQKVEKKGNKTYLTIKFKLGTKKLDAHFIKEL